MRLEISKRLLFVILSFAGAALIAIVWFVYWRVTGDSPMVDELQLTGIKKYVLPFAFSRAWSDLAVWQVWALILNYFLTLEATQKDRDGAILVVFPLGLGFIWGIVACVTLGLSYGIFTGLLVAAFSIALSGLIYGFLFALSFGVGISLALGAGYSLLLGLPCVLAASAAALVFGSAHWVLSKVIKKLIRSFGG